MLQDLRRYSLFDSAATRPYTVSAMACWARAQDLGYITLDSAGKVSSEPAPHCWTQSKASMASNLNQSTPSAGASLQALMQRSVGAQPKHRMSRTSCILVTSAEDGQQELGSIC